MEQIDRLQEMMAQQAEDAQTTYERTTSPHVRATVEGMAVAAKPMSPRPATSVGVTRDMPRRADSVASNADVRAKIWLARDRPLPGDPPEGVKVRRVPTIKRSDRGGIHSAVFYSGNSPQPQATGDCLKVGSQM